MAGEAPPFGCGAPAAYDADRGAYRSGTLHYQGEYLSTAIGR